MKYTLHDGTHIHSSGYSNEADAIRISGELGLSVIESDVVVDIYANVVDGQTIRVATQAERDAHPRNIASIAGNARRARLLDDRDNRGRDSMPQLADMVNDALHEMNLDDK